MRLNLKPVEQQTIVITGASSGIGLATAELAASKGARVVLSARNAEALDQAAHGIEAAGGRAITVPVDIALPESAAAITTAAVGAFGGFDTWVNDAATAMYASVTDTSEEELRRVFDVGFFGLVRGAQEAVRHLRGKGGAIVNLGSVLSERTMIYQGAYSSMKHAVRGWTDALRMELAAAGTPVSVTLIKPTGMDTPYPEHARDKLDSPVRIPPLLYDPRLVARAIVWAAAHPKREITVGGTGLAISKGGNLAPSLMDAGMVAFGRQIQLTDQPEEPGTRDNLFDDRRDGRIDSNQRHFVRQTSLWLEAQLRPVAATAVISAVTALAMIAAKRAASPAARARGPKQGGPTMRAMADGRRR